MEIKYLSIKNFKSIRHMEISDIQNALILVGKNNTGKSSILHALRAVEGSYEISLDDFNETMQNIEIGFILSVTEEDLHIFHKNQVELIKKGKQIYLYFYLKLFQQVDHNLNSPFLNH